MNVELSAKEIKERIKKLKPFELKVKGGWLGRYAALVTSADTGAVFKTVD